MIITQHVFTQKMQYIGGGYFSQTSPGNYTTFAYLEEGGKGRSISLSHPLLTID